MFRFYKKLIKIKLLHPQRGSNLWEHDEERLAPRRIHVGVLALEDDHIFLLELLAIADKISVIY